MIKSKFGWMLAMALAWTAQVASAHELALKEVKVEIGGAEKVAYALTGKVLYTFENDVASRSSTCTGACVEIWPAVLLNAKEVAELKKHNGEVEVYGLDGQESDKSGFDVLNRGTRSKPRYQLTFNGWPLYYYAFDRSEDDAYGDEHNPGGIHDWYAFTSDFAGH